MNDGLVLGQDSNFGPFLLRNTCYCSSLEVARDPIQSSRPKLTKHQRQLLPGNSPRPSAATPAPFIPVVPVSTSRSSITPSELAVRLPNGVRLEWSALAPEQLAQVLQLGFRQFLMRGLANVRNEWTLVCLAWNLKRMAVLRPQQENSTGALQFHGQAIRFQAENRQSLPSAEITSSGELKPDRLLGKQSGVRVSPAGHVRCGVEPPKTLRPLPATSLSQVSFIFRGGGNPHDL